MLARRPSIRSYTFAAALRCASEDHFQPRTCDPSSVSSPLSDFDSAVHKALEAKTGSAVSESQHLLPVPKGVCLGSYVDTNTLADQIINNSSQQAPGSVQSCLRPPRPAMNQLFSLFRVFSPLKLKPSSPSSSMPPAGVSVLFRLPRNGKKPGCCPTLWSMVATGFRMSL